MLITFGFAQVPDLKTLLDYRKKQKKKCTRLNVEMQPPARATARIVGEDEFHNEGTSSRAHAEENSTGTSDQAHSIQTDKRQSRADHVQYGVC